MRQPTDREIRDHAATHLPFQDWCSFCEDKIPRRLHGTNSQAGEGGHWQVSHTDGFHVHGAALCVVGHDGQLDANGEGSTCEFKVGEQKAGRGSCAVYLEEEVVFVMDQEPATVSLLNLVVATRQRLGRKCSQVLGKAYDKSRTARMERFIETVRNQALALVAALEEYAGHDSWRACNQSLGIVSCSLAFEPLPRAFRAYGNPVRDTDGEDVFSAIW